MAYESQLQSLEEALKNDKLTSGAVENIRLWLSEPRYAEYADQVADLVDRAKWSELDDAFWTIIPFGTGGRRGRMYPVGSNAINDRTIGESAQGLASYLVELQQKGQLPGGNELSCAIAYDTRHRSRHFAELCAGIMAANGFRVCFLDGHRSTPELSFAVRHKQCTCGIMVTASHNPPSDNAVKVYWSTGGQVLPPHDKGIIDQVMSVDQIKRVSWEEAKSQGHIEFCQDEVDAAFIAAVCTQSCNDQRNLKAVYSPLHGVGATAVVPVLQKVGFTDVEVFGPHAEPDGDFPNVPDHVSNPENPAVFDAIASHAASCGADLAIATDPDCDRLGCSAPLTTDPGSAWAPLTGNQIGALLCDFVLSHRAGEKRHGYVVETLVTTQFIRRIAESYDIRTVRDLMVGFKWIAGAIDKEGPEHFLFAAEESHGYQVGTHVRDKDAAVAALLLCEMAAELKANGQTLHEKLDALMWQHGAHAEKTVSVMMPGSEGMEIMQAVMTRLREYPPKEIAGAKVLRTLDYQAGEMTEAGGAKHSLDGPRGNMVMLEFSWNDNYVAVRPSGTEPKIKFYMFAYEPAEQLANLDDAKQHLHDRLVAMEADLKKYVSQ